MLRNVSAGLIAGVEIVLLKGLDLAQELAIKGLIGLSTEAVDNFVDKTFFF